MCTQLDGVTSHKATFATASLSAVSELSHNQLHISSCYYLVLLFIVFIYFHLDFVSLLGIFPRLSLIMP
jgi:hypothetical protein